MKKLLFIAIIAVLGCTALQAKNRIRIKRESWEVKAKAIRLFFIFLSL